MAKSKGLSSTFNKFSKGAVAGGIIGLGLGFLPLIPLAGSVLLFASVGGYLNARRP